jgi:putative copper export protein/mono/diheme cytochrome c family protein/peroxiredoxin
LESNLLYALAALVRWVHLAACVGLAGIAAFLLLAGRSEPPCDAVAAWRARMLRWSRVLVGVAIGGGVLTLVHQAIVFENRLDAAFDLQALARVLFDTQVGLVWLVRHALLVLLAACLAAHLDESRTADWFASRVQALVIGVLALALIGASGHAAAVEPDTLRAIATSAVHLLATGLWVGGLPVLAALLHGASRDAAGAARAYAARATGRFSNVALASVIMLAVTGTMNALWHVGSFAALVGTAYGQLLLFKLSLLVPIVGLAAVARLKLVPAIRKGTAVVAFPAFLRLRRIAVAESGLAASILLVVALMGVTRPGRHDQPTWPFGFRLVSSTEAAGAGAIPTAALVDALPTRVVDANPTTFKRPSVPYSAASIVNGQAVYLQHCAACHGGSGAGDGPLASTAGARPVDLRSPRVRARTAGDLFWAIENGVPRLDGHAFRDRTTVEERWDLVNYVRTLEAAEIARKIGPTAEPTQPRIVAPDFLFTIGPVPPRALRDFRGARNVLLVLYSLPQSKQRLIELTRGLDSLDLAGVEIIAVPTHATSDAIRELADVRGLYFNVLTDGTRDIVDTYKLLAGGAQHAEFLIDRQGYVRTRMVGEAALSHPLVTVLAEAQRLRREQPAAPAEEHIH